MSEVYRRITPQEFKEQMEELNKIRWTEEKHIYADELMCDVLRQLGYSEGVEIYKDMAKWYS